MRILIGTGLESVLESLTGMGVGMGIGIGARLGISRATLGSRATPARRVKEYA